jgi:hypothetical protein
MEKFFELPNFNQQILKGRINKFVTQINVLL